MAVADPSKTSPVFMDDQLTNQNDLVGGVATMPSTDTSTAGITSPAANYNVTAPQIGDVATPAAQSVNTSSQAATASDVPAASLLSQVQQFDSSSLSTPQAVAEGIGTLDDQTTWNATTADVTDDQLVANQLQKLLDSNSAYVDQARQRAIQLANARGLQNSTLAASAGEEAAIAQALPIAQQDASTYANQALTNQNAQNSAGEFNATQGMTARSLQEQARQYDNTLGLETDQLSESARQADNSTALQQDALTEQQRQATIAANQNRDSLLEQQRQADMQQALADAQLTEQQRQFDTDTQTKLAIAQLDSDSKAYLANIEAQYKNLMQSSASAAELFQQYQQSFASIMTNADLDAENKQAALNMLYENLQSGMNVVGSVASLDLGSLLTFTNTVPQDGSNSNSSNSNTSTGGGLYNGEGGGGGSAGGDAD